MSIDFMYFMFSRRARRAGAAEPRDRSALAVRACARRACVRLCVCARVCVCVSVCLCVCVCVCRAGTVTSSRAS